MDSFVEVDINIIISNIKKLNKNNGKKIGLFLKNNFFGLGIEKLNGIIFELNSNVEYICCDDYSDLVYLRVNGYTGILIYYGWLFDKSLLLSHNIFYSIKSEHELERSLCSDDNLTYVLVFDCGLNREGIKSSINSDLLLKARDKLNIYAIWSQTINRLNPLSKINSSVFEVFNDILCLFGSERYSLLSSSTFTIPVESRLGTPRIGQLILGIWREHNEILTEINIKSALTLNTYMLTFNKIKFTSHAGYGGNISFSSGDKILLTTLGFQSFIKISRNIDNIKTNIGMVSLIAPNYMSYCYVKIKDEVNTKLKTGSMIIFNCDSYLNNIFSTLSRELDEPEMSIVSSLRKFLVSDCSERTYIYDEL